MLIAKEERVEINKHFRLEQLTISCHWSLSITPGKMRKPLGFCMFSGGIERKQWHEIGGIVFLYFASNRFSKYKGRLLQAYYRIAAIKNFTKFTRKHL